MRKAKLSTVRSRLTLRLQRELATRLARRPLLLRNSQPLVSFTFDDFPRSALHCGGEILHSHGLAGTFFASFGLMGRTAPTGQIFIEDDLIELIEQQHELGCHTFDHCHSWDTAPSAFKASIIKNRAALAASFPQMRFRTFSYPISVPRPRSKWETGGCFDCCRGGGQDFNAGTADLAQLKAFFIEQSRSDLSAIVSVIENNARHNGWLIFATHDVSDSPTRFGCTPGLFEDIVNRAIDSGAIILPVAEALDVANGLSKSRPPSRAEDSPVANN